MSFGWVGEIVEDEEEREARGSFHFFDSPLIKVTFGNLGGRQIFSLAVDFHSCPPSVLKTKCTPMVKRRMGHLLVQN